MIVGRVYFENTCDGEFRNLLSIVYYNFAMHVRLSYVSLLDEVYRIQKSVDLNLLVNNGLHTFKVKCGPI